MNVYRGQAEQINDLRAENRALEAQRAAQRLPGEVRGVEPTSEPAGNDARRWVGWWPALALVSSPSCQSSASTKHAGLCTSARATMDLYGNELAGQPLPGGAQQATWSVIESAIRTVEKVC